MPITQDRMKTLVDAAENIASSYITLGNQIAQLIRKHKLQAISTDEMIEQLSSLCPQPEAMIAHDYIIVNREQIKWQYSHSKNRQETRRRAKRRAEARGQVLLDEEIPAKAVAAPQSPRRVDNPALDPDAGLDEIELETTASPGGYTPGELSPEAKAQIEAEAERLAGIGEAHHEYRKLDKD